MTATLQGSGRHPSIVADIDAPPELVWGIMAEVARWPEWTKSVASVDLLTPGPLAVGQRVRIKQPKLPAGVWTVISLEEGRSFSWETRSPGVVIVGDHIVEKAGAGSRVTLGLHFGGPLGGLVARFTREITQLYLGYEAAGLTERSMSVKGA